MSKIFIFIIGLFVGAVLGVIITALMITASRNDEIICQCNSENIERSSDVQKSE